MSINIKKLFKSLGIKVDKKGSKEIMRTIKEDEKLAPKRFKDWKKDLSENPPKDEFDIRFTDTGFSRYLSIGDSLEFDKVLEKYKNEARYHHVYE